MMRQRDENVMPTGPGDYGHVMLPVLPRTPLSNDLNVSIRQRLDELDAVMRDFRRLKYLAHGLRSFGRDQFALLQQQKIAEQLSHGCGVGIVAHRVANALAALAVMLANPDSASVIALVEMI